MSESSGTPNVVVIDDDDEDTVRSRTDSLSTVNLEYEDRRDKQKMFTPLPKTKNTTGKFNLYLNYFFRSKYLIFAFFPLIIFPLNNIIFGLVWFLSKKTDLSKIFWVMMSCLLFDFAARSFFLGSTASELFEAIFFTFALLGISIYASTLEIITPKTKTFYKKICILIIMILSGAVITFSGFRFFWLTYTEYLPQPHPEFEPTQLL